MADELPPAVQRFLADVTEYVAALEAATRACNDFANANDRAAAEVAADTAAMGRDMAELAGAVRGLSGQLGDLRDALAATGLTTSELRDALARLMASTKGASNAAAGLADMERVQQIAAERLLNTVDDLIRANMELGASEATIRDAMAATVGETDELLGANIALADSEDALREAFEETVAAIVAGAEIEDGALGKVTAAILANIGAAEADKVAQEQLADAFGDVVTKALEAAAVTKTLNDNFGQLRDVTGPGSFMVSALGERMQALAVDMHTAERAAADLAVEQASLAHLAKINADATTQAATGVRIWGTGIRLAGVNWMTFAHWIVAGSAEFLAVAIPALVALGAGALVAMQGAQNLSNHMVALYDTLETDGPVFHQTVGSVLGLKSALQQAQDSANPGIYELLGSAVNDAKTGFEGLAGTGLQVVHMFDQFAARVTLDLRGTMGGEVRAALSSMIPDLQRFGEVLGNIGHALLNVAVAMPGLAEHLLGLLSAFTGLLRIVTSLPAPILTFAMGLEEFYRWGGLAVSMLARLTGQFSAMNAIAGDGGFIIRFGAGLVAMALAGERALVWAGQMVGRLAGLSAAAGRAGTAITQTGTALGGLAEDLGPAGMAGIAGAVAAFFGLAVMLGHVQDAAQRMASAALQAVQAASGMQVLAVVASKMTVLDAAIQQTSAGMARMSLTAREAGAAVNSSASNWDLLSSAFAEAGKLTGGLSGNLNAVGAGLQHTQMGASAAVGAVMRLWASFSGASQASSDMNTLTTAQQKMVTTAQTVISNGRILAGVFHTDLPSAIAMATAAGVNLQQSMAKNSFNMQVAIQQVRNLIQGLGDMRAPAGEVGNDMMAMGIQSQLAGTHVQQLNQAWDQWIQSVTAGTNGMSQLQTTLYGMDHAALQTKLSVTGAIAGIKTATQGTTYTLRGFGQTAMQSWQQFNGAVQSGEQSIDTLKTGMAEGAVSNQHFTSTIRALVGEMLPYTQGNKAAVESLSELAARAGGPVTTSLKQLANWAGITGKAARDQFAKGMEDATVSMGKMAQVAQNLSAVVGQQLDSTMAAAINKSSGLDAAMQQYAQDLSDAHTPAATLAGDLQRIYDREQTADRMTRQSAEGLNKVQHASDAAAAAAQRHASAVNKAAVATQGLTQRLAGMGNNAAAATAKVDTGVTAHLSNLPAKLKQIGNLSVNAIVGAIHGGAGRAGGAATSIAQAVHGKLQAMQSQAAASGRAASAGLASGILAGEGAAVSAAAQVADAVANAMRAHLQTRSPSKVTQKIGHDTIAGLVKGLTGDNAAITAAINDVVNAIKSALTKGTVSLGQKSSLTAWVESDNKRLKSLAAQRKAIAAQIKAGDAAQQATLTSMNSIIGLTHAPTPYTGTVTTPQQMVSNLKTEIADMKRFASDLKKLKALGLDNSIIARIIAMGPMEGDKYAQALIAAASASGSGTGPGGPNKITTPGGALQKIGASGTGGTSSIIAQLNSSWNQVHQLAKSLSTQVANDMYDGGTAAGKGLMQGLKSQEKALDDEMKKIADVLVKRLKHDLRIHSPSGVFADHGTDIAKGLAQGITSGTPLVIAALHRLTDKLASQKIIVPLMIDPKISPVAIAPHGSGGPGVNPGGVNVTVKVEGSVLTDQNLADVVRKEVLRYTHRNSGNGLFLSGKAS